MASVPNMRLTPTPAGKSQATGAEAPEADLFARLMATPANAPATDVATALLTGDSGEAATAPTGDGTDEDKSALDLALPVQAADFLPLIEAQAAAPVTAKSAAVGDSAPAPDTETGTVPTALGMTACGLPIATPIAPTAAPVAASAPATPLPSAPIQAAAVTTPPAPRVAASPEKAAPDSPAVETLTIALPNVAEPMIRAAAKPVRTEAPAIQVSTPTDPAGATLQLAASLLARPATRGDERRPASAAPEIVASATALSPTPAAPAPLAAPAFAPVVELSPASAAGPTHATAPAAAAEPAIERQLDLAQDTEWLDQLARDIAGAGERDAPMRFRLHPQTLGHLRVELSQSDLGTSVRLTADTEAARAILVDAQPRLVAEARAQGLRLAESHVDLAGSGERGTADSRRQDGERTPVTIRTARGAGTEAETSDDTRRSDSERYA